MADDIGDVEVDVVADFSGFEARLYAMLARMARKMDVNVPVDVDTSKATKKMAIWRRLQERALDMKLSLNGKSMAVVSAQLASLTGIGQLVGAFSHFNNMLLSIHENILRVSYVAGLLGAAAGPLVVLLGSLTMAGVEAGKALGGGLLAVLAALPGLYTAGALSVLVFNLALRDTEKVLGETFTQYRQLRNIISENFWKTAEDGVRSLLDNSFVPLKAGFIDLSDSAGKFTGRLALELDKVLTPGKFEIFFGNISSFFDILGEKAAGPLSRITATLLEWGSGLLPGIADWMSKIAIEFDKWLQNGGTEKLSGWLTDLGNLLKGIGTTFWEFGGALSGIADAAEAAGIKAFPFAAMMTKIHDIIDSPPFQAGLTEFFANSLRGAEGMKVAFEPLMSLLGSMAPVIGKFIGDAGVALGSFGETLFNALNQPGVMENFGSLLDSFVKVIGNLEPALGPFVSKLSEMMHFAGVLADVVSSGLSVAIQELAPVVSILLKAFEPLVIALGEGFQDSMKQWGPGLKKIAYAIAGLIGGFTVFVEAFNSPVIRFVVGLLVDFFATAIAGAINLAAGILKIVGGLLKLLSGDFSGLNDIWDGIKQGLLGIWQLFITLFAPAKILKLLGPVGKIILELFGKAFSGLGPLVTKALGSLGPLVMTAMAAVGEAIIWGLKGGAFRVIGGALVSIVDWIVNGIKPLLGGVLVIFGEIAVGVIAVLSGIWGVVTAGFFLAWEGAKIIFQAFVLFITTALQIGAAIFSVIFGVMKAVGVAVWNAIKTAFNFMMTGITVGIGIIRAIVTVAWSIIKASGQAVWNAGKTAFNLMKGVISAGINVVKSVVTSAWNGIKRVGESIWSGITRTFNTMKSRITSGVSAIKNAFGGSFDWIKSKVSGVFNWITSHIPKIDIPGIPGFASGVRNFAGGLALVGERGPELLVLPKGSDVVPHSQTQSFLNSSSEKSLSSSTSEPTRIFKYYAADGPSLSSSEQLFAAASRARMVF